MFGKPADRMHMKERELSIINRVAAVMLAFGSAACDDADRSPEMIQFKIKDARFSVPSEAVRSVRDRPSGFIRINDPETPIELVYDQQLQQKSDERGYPVLFSVNDGDYPRIAYLRAPDGAPIVCRVAAAAPYGGCGSPIEFKGSTWAVLFPVGRVGEAEAFRRRAETVLQNFST